MDISVCERLKMDIDKLTIGAIIGSVFLYDFKDTTIKKSLTKINKNTFLLLPNIRRAINIVS
jgi:hypothetical protein